MVHAFDDTVDCVGKLIGFIEIDQVSEVTAVFTASKAVLNVLADGCVDISSCRFIITEGGICDIQNGIVEINLSCTQRSAITNILIDIVDAQKSCVFTEGDKRGVDHLHSVIELFVFGKPKSQRIGSRHHDLDTLHRIDVGEQRGRVNKVLK